MFETKDSRKVDLIILLSGDVLCYYYGDLLTEEQVSEKYDQHEITPDRLMKIYPFNQNAPVFIDASNNCLVLSSIQIMKLMKNAMLNLWRNHLTILQKLISSTLFQLLHFEILWMVKNY